MNKKILAIIISLPALLLLFIFKVIPAFYSVIISLKDYNIFQGISRSISAGLANYTIFFIDPRFMGIIGNTFLTSLLSITLTCILAGVLILCIIRMPNIPIKVISIIILAIPAFIPVTSYAGILLKIFSADTGYIRNPVINLLLFIITDTLRNVYIPVIIGVLACDKGTSGHIRKIAFVLIGYIAARSTMLLSPDVDSIMASYNIEVFDTFSFRSGLQNMHFSLASAAWIVKTIPQLIINIIIYYVLRRLAPEISGFDGQMSSRKQSIANSIIGIIGYLLFAAGSIAVIILALIPASGFFAGLKALLTDRVFIISTFNTLLYSIFGTVLFGFMTLTLSFPLYAKVKFYPVLLVILMSLTNNFMGEYLLIRSFGMIDTVFPVILTSGLTVVGSFALYYSVAGRLKGDSPGLGRYLIASLPPLLTIMTLAFISIWGSYLLQMIYINSPSLYGMGLYGRRLMFDLGTSNLPGGAENIKSAFIFISSIVPTVLGALLICLNKFLPLSAFVSQIRKG